MALAFDVSSDADKECGTLSVQLRQKTKPTENKPGPSTHEQLHQAQAQKRGRKLSSTTASTDAGGSVEAGGVV